jgi:hypothetical protein
MRQSVDEITCTIPTLSTPFENHHDDPGQQCDDEADVIIEEILQSDFSKRSQKTADVACVTLQSLPSSRAQKYFAPLFFNEMDVGWITLNVAIIRR